MAICVVLVAVRLGRGPAMLAAVLSVAAFDFFFVAPRFSFAVSDVQYLVTFAVMLGVGMLIGQLTANLRFAAGVSASRERRAHALFELTRDLSAALQTVQVVELGQKEGKIVATFDLGDEILASPAVADGAIYLRSNSRLHKLAR